MANAAENLAGKDKVEKRRALGRGLESLLPGPRAVPRPTAPTPAVESPTAAQPAIQPPVPPVSASSAPVENLSSGERNAAVISPPQPQASATPGSSILQLNIADIDRNPFQTRHIGDLQSLEELAASINVSGVIQPISVRPADEQGRYVLILGERRLRASKLAGKTTIPAVVKRVSLQQAAEMTVIENLQRQDLNCIEQAEAFRVLSTEFNLTQAQIGERVGMARESVSNYMRLLKLPPNAMEHLASGKLTFGQGKELLKLDDLSLMSKASDQAVTAHMNFEQVAEMVTRMLTSMDPLDGLEKQKKQGEARWIDPNVKAAQTELERILGLRVRIRDRKGKGKILIEYASVDDYERVVGMLTGK